MSGKVEGEPPRKKRRSKWDIHPEDLHTMGNQETTPPQAPTSAAAAMAAKLNAKLASEGKLKPSSAVYMPVSSSVSLSSPSPLAPHIFPSSTPGHTHSPIIGTLTGPTSSTIEINDLDVREQLTKPATLTDINKTTGVMVTVRGKQITSEERAQEGNTEAPLHLHIQGPNKDKVDAAVIYINSLIRSLQQARVKGGVALLSTPPIPPLTQQHSSGPHYIQDKVFVGMEKAPEEFKAKSRIEGIGGSFLGHIASQTGSKVYLRGRGSGFLEPTSGRESFEAMYLYISHSNQEGLTAARKLCESLIQTVQKDFEMWKRSQQPLGFGGQAPQYHRPQFSNPYQQHGAYPQPTFVPMLPSAVGPNFGPPPPGAYPLPPPGCSFYPGPPVQPPAGPYGPPHPGGFRPPPPAEFQPPGPPYHQPPPPHQIPLPPEVNTPEQNTSYHPPNTKIEEVTGSSGPVVQPNPPTKRRFTETANSANGLSSTDSSPYWAKLQEPPQLRRFAEGPTPNQEGTGNTEREPPPTATQDQTRTTVDQGETTREPIEPATQGEEMTLAKDATSEDVSKLVPPPPPPAPTEKKSEATGVPSMPPPSFLPPRVATAATSSDGQTKPSESPQPPPPPTTNDSPPSPRSPPPSSSPPPPPKPKPSGPLVSYGEDSDSDVDS